MKKIRMEIEVSEELHLALKQAMKNGIEVPHEEMVRFMVDSRYSAMSRPSIEEVAYANGLIKKGKASEATQYITDARLRAAKSAMRKADRGNYVRNYFIESLLWEALRGTGKEA